MKIALGECLWSLPVVGGKWWIETIRSFNTKIYQVSHINDLFWKQVCWRRRDTTGTLVPDTCETWDAKIDAIVDESHVQKGIVSNTELTGPKALPKWISTEVFHGSFLMGSKTFANFGSSTRLAYLHLRLPMSTFIKLFNYWLRVNRTYPFSTRTTRPQTQFLGIDSHFLSTHLETKHLKCGQKCMDAKCSNPSIPIWSIHLPPPQIETERNLMIKWTDINSTIFICDNHGLKTYACMCINIGTSTRYKSKYLRERLF